MLEPSKDISLAEARSALPPLRVTSGRPASQSVDTSPFAAAAAAGPPWFTWLILAAAVVAVSSAGAVFATMPEVPFITLAAWRLQLTAVLLCPPCLYQFIKLPPGEKDRTVANGPIIALSGGCLSIHFASWIWALKHTSLVHALLFVCSSPLLIAAGMFVLRKPISRMELCGTACGIVGTAVLCLGAKSDQQVTLIGDFGALVGATTFVGYLSAGSKLRSWMPTFVYACPVTGIAAVVLSLGAIPVAAALVQVSGPRGVCGWLTRKYLPRVIYLAVGPGIVGHTGFNALLRWMSPLTISLSVLLEPLIGSVIGYALGVQEPPGPWTYAGGLVLTVAMGIVVWAQHQRLQVDSEGDRKRRSSLLTPSPPRASELI